ncbi:MAG TPA: hypothetical protein VMZ53_23715, partial [Kofleriaceae bacterium]|nr:hypothetical protein [Kofleriaceae bacterium]
ANAATNAANAASDAADSAAMAERSAQVRLADMLGNVDSIDEVRAHGHTFTFLVEHADATGYEAPFAIVATTGDAGNVISVVEHARVASDMDLGGLSWLVDTMQQTIAVTSLDVDDDGSVTLTTNDGARYMAIPGRGSGGSGATADDAGANIEVEARWAAEFDHEPQS